MPGRGWAYIGVGLGGLVSIAANVAHSFIPPGAAPTGWAPEPGAVVGAIVWPVFLFIAVEILARVAWPHGRIWQAVRWAGLLPVAVVAALVSYRHLSGLLAHYGEEGLVVRLGPIAVDGLMVMAAGALLATGRHRNTPDIALNSEPTAMAAAPARPVVVSSSAPASTLTSVPSTADTAVPSRADVPAPSIVDIELSPVDTDPVVLVPAPTPVPSPATVAARITTPRPTPTAPAAEPRAAARPARPRPSCPPTPAAPLAPSATDTPVTAPDAAQHAALVVSPDLLARARHVARQYRTEHGTPITAGQLAVRLKVTSEHATQALALLDLAPDSPTTPIPTVNGKPVRAAR